VDVVVVAPPLLQPPNSSSAETWGAVLKPLAPGTILWLAKEPEAMPGLPQPKSFVVVVGAATVGLAAWVAAGAAGSGALQAFPQTSLLDQLPELKAFVELEEVRAGAAGAAEGAFAEGAERLKMELEVCVGAGLATRVG